MRPPRPSLRLLTAGALVAAGATGFPTAASGAGAPALLTAAPQNATLFYGGTRVVYLFLTDAAGLPLVGEHIHVELYRDTNRDGRYNLFRTGDKITGTSGDIFAATSYPRYIGNDPAGITIDLLIACVGTVDCGAVTSDPDGDPSIGENSTVPFPAAPGVVAGARTLWILPPATITFDAASLTRTYGTSASLGVTVRDATGRGVGGVPIRFELYRDSNGDGLSNRMAAVVATSDVNGRIGLQYSLAAYQGSEAARIDNDTVVACSGSADCGVASDPGSVTSGEDTTLRLPQSAGLVAAATVRWSQ
jgi:hypothetical protein